MSSLQISWFGRRQSESEREIETVCLLDVETSREGTPTQLGLVRLPRDVLTSVEETISCHFLLARRNIIEPTTFCSDAT